MQLSLEKQLAVAVLAEDEELAKVLVDALHDKWGDSVKQLPPIHKISVPADRLLVVFYLKDDVPMDRVPQLREDTAHAVRDWLAGRRPSLVVGGVDRIELYELPPTEKDRATAAGMKVYDR